LLLGYFAPDGDLLYAGRVGTGNAGRVGTGMPVAELERVWQSLRPLAIDKMRLSVLPPRNSRFGSPRVLSKIHWVRTEMIVEVSYVEWTPDGLLRHVIYLGERRTNRPSMCDDSDLD
jgi:bifunctional non-homologous end joining protein LigD